MRDGHNSSAVTPGSGKPSFIHNPKMMLNGGRNHNPNGSRGSTNTSFLGSSALKNPHYSGISYGQR